MSKFEHKSSPSTGVNFLQWPHTLFIINFKTKNIVNNMSCLEKSYVKEKFKEFCMWIKKGLKNNINNIVFYLSSTKIKVKENTNYKSHNVHTQFTLTRSLARVFKPIFVTFASSFYSSFIFFLFLRSISLLPIKCFSSVFFKSSSKWQVAS